MGVHMGKGKIILFAKGGEQSSISLGLQNLMITLPVGHKFAIVSIKDTELGYLKL